MIEQQARAICQANGSILLSYEQGRAAFLVLPSREQVVISVGTDTAKIIVRRPIIGWLFPKTIASQQITVWAPEFPELDQLRRFACGSMVLDGLIELVSECRSLSEIKSIWHSLRNPIGVAGVRRA